MGSDNNQGFEEKNRKLLDELETRLKLHNIIADTVSDIIYVIDPDSRIIEVNKRVEKYGYKAEELRGKLFSDLVPEDYKETAKQVVIERRTEIRNLRKGKKPQHHQIVEIPFITKSNEVFEFQASGSSFLSDFKLHTFRIHEGEPIKKNHIYTVGIARDVTQQRKLEREKEKLIEELKASLEEVKKLSGFLPICASCKKIRDDKGYWNQIEAYIEQHSEALFTHSVCPDCADKLYKNEKWYQDRKTDDET